MMFYISVYGEGKYLRFKVEQVYLSDQLEKYKVSGRNKSITLQSNRPLLRAKGMKTRRPDWKLIEGQLQDENILRQIIENLNGYLKKEERGKGLPGWD
ncbi:MAG: hypothetical protein JNK14_09115 [Chitinophagaceae bacterium]|nr:hypothetical protein [Chitinophagaceae bacterium]